MRRREIERRSERRRRERKGGREREMRNIEREREVGCQFVNWLWMWKVSA
jgi:hypothetical protein